MKDDEYLFSNSLKGSGVALTMELLNKTLDEIRDRPLAPPFEPREIPDHEMLAFKARIWHSVVFYPQPRMYLPDEDDDAPTNR